MNERLPYEEQLAQQWDDLSLPDENKAWEDMRRRLEEDDDHPLIPFWLRGCGLWGLVAIVLVGLGWWGFRPDKWWKKKQEVENVNSVDRKKQDSTNKNDTIGLNEEKTGPVNNKDYNNSGEKSTDKIDTSISGKGSFTRRSRTRASVPHAGVESSLTKKQNKKSPGVKKKRDKQVKNSNLSIGVPPPEKGSNHVNEAVGKTDTPSTPRKDTLDEGIIKVLNTDSTSKPPIDSAEKNENNPVTKTNEPKKDSTDKKDTTSFSAGLAVHQLIPIDGQTLTPYNSFGRKGSLADYIPSAFGRMYWNNKWYVQGEFRFGAPQSTGDILYQTDTASQGVSTIRTSYTLKKTYYHQLSFSFNYFVLPDWSMGTGFTWNKFYSAVSEESVNKKNNITQTDSLISKQIVADQSDSASVFSKSYFQMLIVTQYRWKRFSFGASYSFGLQPYIKFVIPGAPEQQERNKSLQIFVRYEIWRSKPKR